MDGLRAHLGAPPVLHEHEVHSDDERMHHIFARVHKAIRDPQYRARAIRKTRRCASRDDMCELQALFADQKRRIKYMADVRGIDTYQNPIRTEEWEAGDCDDHLAKMIAEATSIGFAAGARIMSPDSEPEATHTYGIVGVPKEEPTRIVTFDTTVDGFRLGDEPPKRLRKWQRDFWYAEDDAGNPIVQMGGSEGWRIRPITVVLIFAAAAAVVTVGVVVWRSRSSGTRRAA